jgi:hypothetical protein
MDKRGGFLLQGRNASACGSFFFFHFSFIIHMCIQGLVHFSPPAPTPSLTTHSTPSRSPPQYPAETILPLSLILL